MNKSDLLFSAEDEKNLDELKNLIFEGLSLKRIYMKEKGEDADRDEPLILREGDTVEDALETLPGDMKERFKRLLSQVQARSSQTRRSEWNTNLWTKMYWS